MENFEKAGARLVALAWTPYGGEAGDAAPLWK